MHAGKIAERVRQIVHNAGAVTLYGGYALKHGETVRFPAAHIANETRNKDGRCTRLTAIYADGSKLLFTWSQSKGAEYTVC